MLGAMAKGASKPSAVIDTRVIYCGDNLDQLRKFPESCVDLIYIDPPFNSNRNYEVFWGETKENRNATPKIPNAVSLVEIHFFLLHLLLCNTFVSHFDRR